MLRTMARLLRRHDFNPDQYSPGLTEVGYVFQTRGDSTFVLRYVILLLFSSNPCWMVISIVVSIPLPCSTILRYLSDVLFRNIQRGFLVQTVCVLKLQHQRAVD